MTREGSAFARRRLGAQLRELRAQAGLDELTAAEAFRMPPLALSRIEAGLVPVHDQDLELLLPAYGSAAAGLEHALRALAKTSRDPAAWDKDPGLVPDALRLYLSLEAEADLIRLFAPDFIPDIAQAGESARADFSDLAAGGAAPWVSGHIARRRRGLLELPEPPPVWASRIWVLIQWKALFWAPSGDEQIIGRQLIALRAACERPWISVQIVPDEAPAAADAPGLFSIVRAGEPPATEFAYEADHPVTDPARAQTILDRRRQQFDALCSQSYEPGQTAEIVDRLLDELTSNSG